jgi:hypothetical protein
MKKSHFMVNAPSSIVKGMWQHSRTSSGQKELTDINALADEYLAFKLSWIKSEKTNHLMRK